MKFLLAITATALLCLHSVTAFGVVSSTAATVRTTSTTALSMASGDDDLLRSSRSKRQAGNDDNLVELTRPLGLVLNQDENGNVYVETVAPRGNAARTGKVRCVVSCFDVLCYCDELCDAMWCGVM